MKKQLIAFVATGLIAISQLALSTEQESVEQRCEQEATEKEVSDNEYDAFMEECIALHQEDDSQQEKEIAQREDEPEKD